MTAQVIKGDARTLPLDDASMDAIVCDPPYELSFMGRRWDRTGVAYDVDTWREAMRVLKPGGHMLAFGGTRTWHRLACAIEDAGFELRDNIAWMYGSGFPKSLDVGKAIDKAPATDDARRWQGWGTALKPAFEPIVVARKPLAGTVAANVLAHGTGGINVDGCRVAASCNDYAHPGNALGRRDDESDWRFQKRQVEPHALGRWPTNVVLTHQSLVDDDGEVIGDACDPVCVDGCPVAELDAQSGERPGMARATLRRGATTGRSIGGTSAYGTAAPQDVAAGYGDTGGASRFFPTFRYQAKAPSKERPKVDGVAHPTVKPLGLMRWLVRLVAPPDGIVLDQFAGSGSTVEAAILEGFSAVGVDIDEDGHYVPMIQQRIRRVRN